MASNLPRYYYLEPHGGGDGLSRFSFYLEPHGGGDGLSRFSESRVRFVLMHKTNFGDEKYVQHKHKSHFVFVLHKHKFNFANAPMSTSTNEVRGEAECF
jgi:hypothetical protein